MERFLSAKELQQLHDLYLKSPSYQKYQDALQSLVTASDELIPQINHTLYANSFPEWNAESFAIFTITAQAIHFRKNLQ